MSEFIADYQGAGLAVLVHTLMQAHCAAKFVGVSDAELQRRRSRVKTPGFAATYSDPARFLYDTEAAEFVAARV